jgi:ATP-dependent protease ClpP protease subunit
VLKVNAKAGEAEILLYDNIGEDPWFGGGISAKAFNDALQQAGKVPISLRINSGGGSVFEGAAMYNMLRRHPKPVNVYVDGLAASIASVIAMAGETIQMGETSWIMIHDPWTFALGSASDLRQQADLLDSLGDELVLAYTRKTGLSAAEVKGLMNGETWFNPTDAVAKGFADSIFESQKAAAWAPFDRFGYKHVPEPVATRKVATNIAAGIASMTQALQRRGINTA